MSQLLNDAGEPRLLTSIADGIGCVTINRPEARNAMSSDVREGLFTFFEDVRGREDVRVVLIQAAGKSFVAGGDIKAFGEGLAMTPEDRATDMKGRAAGAGALSALISTLPQPVIVAARGYAVGVGASLLFASDLAIVSETAKVGLTHVTLGINPDGAGTFFLPRQVGMKRAAQIALLGEMMNADELLSLGLVNWVVPDAELDERAMALARKLAAGAPVAQQEAKRLLQGALARDIDAQVAAEAESLWRCALTEDYAEGLRAILERRPARFGQQGN
ncbi:Enoyl-CoA hydratase [Novosphingobium sp. CF614]|uniref:enoyl-CoA hydratase/isomerase family protein n=1 Tax=Novosphingobium sp. CF614 TaxID=1884364 RepID=UPI0008F15E4C|nr:enoyl-CoA hydratase-related protein [Novosphingobium sp. CF614]SFF96360.1 Enoyl-CoA hydratase [Novosphingobium sp. CF614]